MKKPLECCGWNSAYILNCTRALCTRIFNALPPVLMPLPTFTSVANRCPSVLCFCLCHSQLYRISSLH